MKKICVLVADDHKIVRLGLAALLATEPDLVSAGEAENGVQAVRAALSEKPDVVIMDLLMPQKDGVEATREILAQLPETKILILTSYGTSNDIALALEAGAAGALMKTADDVQILSVIRKLAAGERYISSEIRKNLRETSAIPDLSPSSGNPQATDARTHEQGNRQHPRHPQRRSRRPHQNHLRQARRRQPRRSRRHCAAQAPAEDLGPRADPFWQRRSDPQCQILLLPRDGFTSPLHERAATRQAHDALRAKAWILEAQDAFETGKVDGDQHEASRPFAR